MHYRAKKFSSPFDVVGTNFESSAPHLNSVSIRVLLFPNVSRSKYIPSAFKAIHCPEIPPGKSSIITLKLDSYYLFLARFYPSFPRRKILESSVTLPLSTLSHLQRPANTPTPLLLLLKPNLRRQMNPRVSRANTRTLVPVQPGSQSTSELQNLRPERRQDREQLFLRAGDNTPFLGIEHCNHQ